MMNLSRFSRMSFTELVSLPNYYIHEIYKQFVNDSIARAKREAEEQKKRSKQKQEESRLQNMRDSSNVQALRAMLQGSGLDNSNDLEDLLEEFEG